MSTLSPSLLAERRSILPIYSNITPSFHHLRLPTAKLTPPFTPPTLLSAFLRLASVRIPRDPELQVRSSSCSKVTHPYQVWTKLPSPPRKTLSFTASRSWPQLIFGFTILIPHHNILTLPCSVLSHLLHSHDAGIPSPTPPPLKWRPQRSSQDLSLSRIDARPRRRGPQMDEDQHDRSGKRRAVPTPGCVCV